MNDNEQAVYRDELDSLHNAFLEEHQDIKYSLKKIDNELFNIYSPVSLRRKYVIGDDGVHKVNTKDLVMWVHFGREKLMDAIKCLDSIKDVLDDIEDEINRDEVNNAK